MYNTIQDFDFMILDSIQKYCKSSIMDRLMPGITFLGHNGLLWILIAVIMLLVKKYRKCGSTMLFGMFGGVLIGNVLIKNIVRRQRPCWINDTVHMLVNIPKDYSFPSGHTMIGFIAATVIFHYDRRLGVPAFIMVFCIAFSRMYLYVHFPTDILGGALLGLGIGYAAIKLTNRFIFNREKHTKHI